MGHQVAPYCMGHTVWPILNYCTVATTLNIGAVGFFVGLVKYDFVTLFWYQVQSSSSYNALRVFVTSVTNRMTYRYVISSVAQNCVKLSNSLIMILDDGWRP